MFGEVTDRPFLADNWRSKRSILEEMTQNIQQSASAPARFSRRKRAVLPHLGNFFFGSIYNALTGNKRFPRPLFKRAVANGLDREQLEAVYRQVSDRHDLGPTMLSIAETSLQQALYWGDVGVKNRARDHYLEAAFWELYGSLLLTDPMAHSKCIARARTSYALATPHFAAPAHEVDIHYMGTVLKGYLRVPSHSAERASDAVRSTEFASSPLSGGTGVRPYADDFAPNRSAGASGMHVADGSASIINTNHPCVILFNGISTPKEELYFTENSLLALGMATFSFDYPFSDDTKSVLNLDAEELGNALLLTLAARTEVDMSRLVAYGTSLGGRVALYVAAKFNQRFRAVATLSAPYDLLTDLDLLLPVMKREFAASPQCTKATLFDVARQTTLRGELHQIEAPTLVVGGGKDIIAMPEETKLIYEQLASSDKKLIICPGAGHNCYEMMPSLRHEIAQWIKQRL